MNLTNNFWVSRGCLMTSLNISSLQFYRLDVLCMVADYLSRIFYFDGWIVKDSYFQTVNSIWGPFTVDCFAYVRNLHQLMSPTCPIYAPLQFVLQLSPGFCALMNWLIYAVVMLSFVKTNMLNYLLPRVRLIFTEMELLLCWLRLGILLARILC